MKFLGVLFFRSRGDDWGGGFKEWRGIKGDF